MGTDSFSLRPFSIVLTIFLGEENNIFLGQENNIFIGLLNDKSISLIPGIDSALAAIGERSPAVRVSSNKSFI